MATGGAFPRRLAISSSQVNGLRALTSAVMASNPFYTAKFDNAGVGYRLRDLGDFLERVPFTTKAEIVEDQKNNPPYGTNLTYPLERYTRCHQTSGSTGTPLRWLDTAESWSWMLGNWEQIYSAAGVTRSDVIHFPFSFGPFLGFWTAFEAAARLGALCLAGGGMSSVARLRLIFEQGATVLCATPTYALRLAEVAAQEGIDLSASPVKLIIVAGEPGGSVAATRARIEQAWPGARVFDHHGMTEVGPVSFECPVRPGVLHIIETSYIAEVIDPVTAAPLQPGETGELVLTTLGRLGSPLIRYRTGDLVKTSVDSVCECGRHEMALEGGIIGRVDDMVVIRGVNIYPTAVEEIMRSAVGLAEYEAIVNRAPALAELEIRVELDAVEMHRAAELEAAFQRAFTMRVPVTAVAVGSLPRSEAKSKRWKMVG